MKHIFAKLQGMNPDRPFSFSYGQYFKAPGFIYKKVMPEEVTNGYPELRNFVQLLSGKRVHVLLYIHGYLAENPWFASLSGAVLHQRIFDVESHDVNLVLSLQWDSGWDYEQNRVLAFEKGRQFGVWLDVLSKILSTENKALQFSCLAHSMGNVVLDGMLHHQKSLPSGFRWNQVFLCAADMPADHFQHGYRYLASSAAGVHVFNHRKDKTLRIANRFMPFHRLGIYGREDSLPFKNVHSLDVTEKSLDDDALGSSFSHHRYFYGSQNVTDYINKALSVSG